jgi:hypothetical protein
MSDTVRFFFPKIKGRYILPFLVLLSGCSGTFLGKNLLPDLPQVESKDPEKQIAVAYAFQKMPALVGYWVASVTITSGSESIPDFSKKCQGNSSEKTGYWQIKYPCDYPIPFDDNVLCSLDIEDSKIPPASSWNCAFKRGQKLLQMFFPQAKPDINAIVEIIPAGKSMKQVMLRYSLSEIPLYYFMSSPKASESSYFISQEESVVALSGYTSVFFHEYYHGLVKYGIVEKHKNKQTEEKAAYLLSNCIGNVIAGTAANTVPDAMDNDVKVVKKTGSVLEEAVAASHDGALQGDAELQAFGGLDHRTPEGRKQMLMLCAKAVHSSWVPAR